MEFGSLSVFNEIYKANYWNGGSGEGSFELRTRIYKDFLQNFLNQMKIAEVVDLGCGDWQFSKFVNWERVRYYGFDVAELVINRNSQDRSVEC